MFLLNPNADRRPYDPELRQVLSVSAGRTARERLATWPLLAPGATPAWQLPGLAKELGVTSAWLGRRGTPEGPL